MTSPLNFIIVDDDFTNNLICQYLFKKTNSRASVRVFTEPGKGLDYIEKLATSPEGGQPTVLLLDINMPGMTGWEFLNQFNKLPPSTTAPFNIYILSSSKEDYNSEIEKYPKVQGFLSKPFTQEKVNLIYRDFS